MLNGAFFCVLIDPGHDIAGFVLDWIKALARRVSRLEVIALEVRNLAAAGLPGNVRVLSLGKELGRGRPRLLAASQRQVWRALSRADFLLCHMMPLYALVAAPICRIKGKPLFLWYTHQHTDLKLKASVRAVDRVFTAVPESMRVETRKKMVLGHGINTDRFRPPPDGEGPGDARGLVRVVSVGRLSPVKRLEVLVDAAVRLRDMNRLNDFRFVLVGRPSTPEQRPYAESIRQRVADQGLGRFFDFRGAAPYAQVAPFYREADLFVSMQEQRGLDKAVLEAMASGLPVVTANESFRPLMGRRADRLMYPPADPDALAERLIDLARQPTAERCSLGLELRERVESGHGLDRLMDLIVAEAARLRA